MRWILVRHGAVEPPRPGVLYGRWDVRLSPEGWQEARRAALALRGLAAERVLTSPLRRAWAGAILVSEHLRGPAPEVADGFVEAERGAWAGLTPEEARRGWPERWQRVEADPERHAPPGGETFAQLRKRVLAARDALLADGSHRRPLVLVAHLHPIRALLADALGLEVARWRELRIPTGSISVLRWEGPTRAVVERIGWKPAKEGETLPSQAVAGPLPGLTRKTT